MDTSQELKVAIEKRQDVVNQINALEQQKQRLEDQKQQLLQEALRMDGEVRLLQRLSKNGTKPSK